MKLGRKVAALALSCTMLFSYFSPINISADEKKFNMSYLYQPSVSEYVQAVNQSKGALDVVTPNYFDVNEDGTLKVTSNLTTSFVEEMHRRNIKVVPFISNHWDRTSGENALKRKDALAEEIASNIARYNLDGINIDFENLNEDSKQGLTDFVQALKTKLPADKTVSIAVAANPNGWTKGWHGSFDYKELGKHADFLMIMAYDESWKGSAPGPVASDKFVRKSIEYAINQGVPREKIVFGIPFYGRLWNETNGAVINGDGVALHMVPDLLETYNGVVTYDENQKSAKATFEIKSGDQPFKLNNWSDPLPVGKYTLWFENDRSIKEKLNLVHEYKIKGTGSWSLGQENKEIWDFYRLWLDGKRFSDVSENHWAKESIWKVEQKGWLRGTSESTFSPEEPVTRAQAAVILVRALNLNQKEAIKQSFTDVPQNFWAYSAIEIAKQHNLFAGVSDNQFDPNAPLSREQTAVVLHRILGNDGVTPGATPQFKDVQPNRWSYSAIEIMKERGIYAGFTDHTFRPTENNTRAQMSALMLRIEPYIN